MVNKKFFGKKKEMTKFDEILFDVDEKWTKFNSERPIEDDLQKEYEVQIEYIKKMMYGLNTYEDIKRFRIYNELLHGLVDKYDMYMSFKNLIGNDNFGPIKYHDDDFMKPNSYNF